ncbi:MAG: patatin-like phospholipase family protein [Candidatus Marinimicrobia bacterium]|nr:patatin-like phospholipase family protein [Candidatus Neomarinimicrobiota bacterium]MCF7827548.1 patatin-like phospholipase family protein [Candidatus Neomarinimicrobiota bacterium]MCF7881590.1 patatin-like phospholipase family protein [Candidatus Neomarinimicrobiota bacterium]
MKSKAHPFITGILLIIILFAGFPIESQGTPRPKVGLALSGGGAMGLAHIGVLHTLDSLDIPVDYIAGTSMGGIVGALYSAGYSAREIDSLAQATEWTTLFRDIPSQQAMPYYLKQEQRSYQMNIEMRNFQPVRTGLIRGQNIRMLFTRLTAPYLTTRDFSELPIPFACTAVDLRSGEVVILDKGSLPTAMRATMSIPSVFTPVPLDSMLLIDGGLLNNLPTDVVRSMGADIVIASGVRNPSSDTENIRSIFDVVSQSFHIARNTQIDEKARQADIFIDTRLPKASAADFSAEKIEEIIAMGYKSARNRTDSFRKLKTNYNLDKTPQMSQPDSVNFRIDTVSTHGHLTPLPPEIHAKIHTIQGGLYTESFIQSLKEEVRSHPRIQEIRYTATKTGALTVHLQFYITKTEQPVIEQITIHGNQQVSAEFIRNGLTLHPGDRYDPETLHNRINYLYSLGYFTNIGYDLSVAGDNAIDINIFVDEHSFQTLRLSVQYNNYYNLVPIAKFEWDNIGLSGLRLESLFHVMGYTRAETELSYHPQEVRYSVFPFLKFYYTDYSKSIYNGLGQRLSTFRERNVGFTLGAGLEFRDNIYTRIGMSVEDLRINPALQLQLPDLTLTPRTHIPLNSLRVTGKFDFLDSKLAPTRGAMLEADFELSDRDILGSTASYARLVTSLDYYRSFGDHHISHLEFFHGQGFGSLPLQKYLYRGGPVSFIGVQYEQLLVKRLTFLRGDYSYRLRKNLLLKLIGNYAFDYQHLAHGSQTKTSALGFGFALQYNSFLGPAVLTIANGPESVSRDTGRQSVAYITVGYRF